MMVLRRKTGWEGLKDDPVIFFEDILKQPLGLTHRNILLNIVDGSEMRVGLVQGLGEGEADEAAFAIGIALWRAATTHRPTIIWGGRRSVAAAWLSHAITVLQKAAPEFRTDFKIHCDKKDGEPWGIKMPNGTWALRYESPFSDDSIAACEAMGDCADVLLGDFSWLDTNTIDDALDFGEASESVVMLLIPKHVSSSR